MNQPCPAADSVAVTTVDWNGFCSLKRPIHENDGDLTVHRHWKSDFGKIDFLTTTLLGTRKELFYFNPQFDLKTFDITKKTRNLTVNYE